MPGLFNSAALAATTTVAPGPVLLPCGDSAILAELPSLTEVLALFKALSKPPDGVLEVVPAARTILVIFDPERLELSQVRDWLLTAKPVTATRSDGPVVTIEVNYDGPDLTEVAQHLGLAVSEVIDLHTSSEWTAAFTGFAPGFAYLVTSHQKLSVPRRDTPRTSIPAGSVALGGEFSAIYPTSSPAGWQLIGHTSALLWDAEKAERAGNPALITPGSRVRFRAL